MGDRATYLAKPAAKVARPRYGQRRKASGGVPLNQERARETTRDGLAKT